MKTNRIIQGDTLTVLKTMPKNYIDTIVTSPPYWGLRDYGIKGQIGLEPTLKEYINKLLAITLELKRVLKPTGIMFWNHGDCYNSQGTNMPRYWGPGYEERKGKNFLKGKPMLVDKQIPIKCLCLQNYRLILRMIDEQNWILRNTIIWNKPNHMPSSVKDRFANSYESVYMLVKSKEASNDIKFWLPRPLSKEDAIWLATMIDTEGTIGRSCRFLTSNPYSFAAYITITNTYKLYLDRAKEITGKGYICERKTVPNRQIWNWRVSNQEAISVIGEIYPYLMEKREQAKTAIALQKINKAKGCPKGSKFGDGQEKMSTQAYQEKLHLYELIKKLNQREISDSGLPEPNLNRTSGCEKYWFDLDSVRIPHITNEDRPFGIVREREFGYDTEYPEVRKKDTFNYRVRDAEKKAKQCPQFKASKEEIESYKKETGKIAGGGAKLNLPGSHETGKNPGDLWTIPTQPFPAAHFATFPEKLVEPMIKAGCPENGIVLDPFAGAATTCVVAKGLGRSYLGIELSPDYVEIAEKRLLNTMGKLL